MFYTSLVLYTWPRSVVSREVVVDKGETQARTTRFDVDTSTCTYAISEVLRIKLQLHTCISGTCNDTNSRHLSTSLSSPVPTQLYRLTMFYIYMESYFKDYV